MSVEASDEARLIPWPLPSVFGTLMKQWETLAPYNAAQVMTLVGEHGIEHDIQHVAHSFDQAIASMGVPWLRASAVVSSVNLNTHLSGEMNRAFAETDPPLRPFVCGNHVGLVYRHWPLDSVCVRLIMRRWFEALHSLKQDWPPVIEANSQALPGVLSLLFTSPKRWLEEVIDIRRQRSVRRLPADLLSTLPIAFISTDLPRGTVTSLVQKSRLRGHTLNDLFLAAAAVVCADLFPPDSSKRTGLSLGTIVDTRDLKNPGDNPQAQFGLSLAFTQTRFAHSSLNSMSGALEELSKNKNESRPTLRDSDLRLAAILRWTRRFDRPTLCEFYRKRAGSSGGISNVNLNRDWHAPHFPSLMSGYLRVSPLGPALPLVFSPTTLGDGLNIGMTYRTNLLSAESAHVALDRFASLLSHE